MPHGASYTLPKSPNTSVVYIRLAPSFSTQAQIYNCMDIVNMKRYLHEVKPIVNFEKYACMFVLIQWRLRDVSQQHKCTFTFVVFRHSR